jgi:hypothetical protein
MCNRSKTKANTSGFKGVSWHKKKRQWVATIGFERRVHVLGYFDDPEAAHRCYCNAADDVHGEFANHG